MQRARIISVDVVGAASVDSCPLDSDAWNRKSGA